MFSQQTKFERVETLIFPDAFEGSKKVVEEIAGLIKAKAAKNEKCILGLATGSTPVGVYKQLVELHKAGNLSFQNVVTFNLDEYYPINPDALQSYVRFMNENLFGHIDIPKQNIHIPDGTLAKKDIPAFCAEYDQMIADAGGLDLLILGIGKTGHIGFNEPGSGANTPTRLISLDFITVLDAASDFFGEENVPKNAITMGIDVYKRQAGS